MGFISKSWKKVKGAAKKVVKIHKKVFNEVLGGKYLKKALWDNKWGRMATMVAAGIFTAGAASAAMAGAGLTASLSAGGAALGSTVSGVASAIGSGISGLTGSVGGAGAGAGSTMAGSGGLLSQAGTLGQTVGGGLGTMGPAVGGGFSSQAAAQAALGGAASTGGAAGGLLSSIASSPYTAPALISVGGNMVAGAAQASAQDKQYRREQADEERKRNAQTAYGVSYDGTTNVDLQTAQAIQQAMAGAQPAGLITQAGQIPAPNVPAPNIQIPQWWNQA